jgi:type IV pilus assembly protein PilO
MADLDPLLELSALRKLVLVSLALAVPIVLGYLLVLAPTAREHAALVARRESLQIELRKARAEEAIRRQHLTRAAALRARLEAARARLPADRDIPLLYRTVTDLAVESGMGLVLFSLRPAERRDAYWEIPFMITAQGTYHQLGAYLARIGRLPRLVTTREMRLTGIDGAEASLRAELILTTYLLMSDGPPPATSDAPPAGALPSSSPPMSRGLPAPNAAGSAR